jgi:SAM-dependent methyltransferase
MSTQYDRLGRHFGEVEALPIRRYVEFYSFFEVLGDLEGKSVLDAGCGTGIYTRLLKKGGAARVVGLDVSGDMIHAAREAEQAQPLGIDYVVGDIAEAGALGPFDIVMLAYVLHHAGTAEEMRAMCRGLHGALAPGGRLVGTMISYDFQSTDPDYYSPYGIRLGHDGSLRDGSPLTISISIGLAEFGLRAHYWTQEGYESALTDAGFSDLVWHAPRVSPAGIEDQGSAFWEAYLARPHTLVLECIRSKGI